MGKRTTLVLVLIGLSIIGIHEWSRETVSVKPDEADSFEYQFDLLDGQVQANPYGEQSMNLYCFPRC